MNTLLSIVPNISSWMFMLCAEYAYRRLPRSCVIRGDLLQVDHVTCIYLSN